MTLRGEVEAFPLDTVVRLIASTNKTGQLEVRSDGGGGSLGFAEGRLVAANAGDDAGEPALGSVFAVQRGTFEFMPWNDPPAANLTGDLDQLLGRAAQERDRIVAIRTTIPDDRSRFKLSERAATRGEITLSADQWRTLLAVNGERDVPAIAEHLHLGRLAALTTLASLAESGFVDVVEPPPAPEPARPAAERATEPRWPQEPPAPPPPEPPRWHSRSETSSWEPEQRWGQAEPDVGAALGARMDTGRPEAPPETPPARSPLDIPPAGEDERFSALTNAFGTPEPVAPEEPSPSGRDRVSEWVRPAAVPESRPAWPARSDTADEWARPAPEPQQDEKRRGLFGFLRRDEQGGDGTVATAYAEPPTTTRAGQLAAFSNALLAEYNNGQYGKGRIDDRMANLLMRIDEQADPIDRPLPIVDDRIDVQALEREDVPEQQAVPYLAMLVSQVYEDAERAFGRDKARRGYRVAQQQVFGSDPSALSSPDLAARLPKM